MFNKITDNPALFAIMCQDCSENNAAVEFNNDLLINNHLDDKKVLILKPDIFYHSKKLNNPPPSPDCLILVHCSKEDHYGLYLIELRDVKNTKVLKYKEIVNKFNTMIEQFFPEFESIFKTVNYEIIVFYLVTTYPKNGGQISDDGYRTKIKGSALDAYSSQKPLKLFNKAVFIQPKPSPLILSPC